MIEIKRVKIAELNALVSSPDYASWDVIPISRHRAKSYVANPRCSPNDTALYLAYLNSKLVGYRTILSDIIYINGNSHKVGWLSGNWVNPSYRRQGIASTLFKAAYSDWNGNLLYTNYALESKAVYDKSGAFELATMLIGCRIYLKPCLAKVLPAKGKIFKAIKPLLVAVDFLLNLANPLPLLSKAYTIKNIDVEHIAKPDDEIKSLTIQLLKNTPTARSEKELDWIINYPWLVSSPLPDLIGKKYFFSSSPRQFEQSILKIYIKNELAGFMLANNHNGYLSIPYLSCASKYEKAFAQIIAKFAIASKCQRVTIYQESIANEFRKMFLFRLLSIKQHRNFYATTNLIKLFDKTANFAEGDGDCAFV